MNFHWAGALLAEDGWLAGTFTRLRQNRAVLLVLLALRLPRSGDRLAGRCLFSEGVSIRDDEDSSHLRVVWYLVAELPKTKRPVAAMPETEADTCRMYVLPKLYEAGWPDEQINEQHNLDIKNPMPARPWSKSRPRNWLRASRPRNGGSSESWARSRQIYGRGPGSERKPTNTVRFSADL